MAGSVTEKPDLRHAFQLETSWAEVGAQVDYGYHQFCAQGYTLGHQLMTAARSVDLPEAQLGLAGFVVGPMEDEGASWARPIFYPSGHKAVSGSSGPIEFSPWSQHGRETFTVSGMAYIVAVDRSSSSLTVENERGISISLPVVWNRSKEKIRPGGPGGLYMVEDKSLLLSDLDFFVSGEPSEAVVRDFWWPWVASTTYLETIPREFASQAEARKFTEIYQQASDNLVQLRGMLELGGVFY